MDERYDEDLFLGYLEGDLSPEQVARFEKQVQENPRLRNLVAQVVLDRHRLRNMPRQAAPPELMERVNQRLERRMLLDSPATADSHEGRPMRRFRLGRRLAYGAVAAMVVVVAAFIFHWLWLPGTTNTPGGDEIAPTRRTPMADAAARANRPMAQMRGRRPGGAMSRGGAADQGMPTLAGGRDDAAPGNAGENSRPGPNPHALGIRKSDPIEMALRRILGRRLVMGNRPMINRQVSSTPMGDVTLPLYEDIAAETGMDKAVGGKTYQPADVGVEVRATSLDQGAAAIRAWAEQNDVRILDQPAAPSQTDALRLQNAESSGTGGGAGGAGAKASAATGSSPTLVLVMEGDQVDDLVSYLKQEAGLTAKQVRVPTRASTAGRQLGGANPSALRAAAPAAAPAAATPPATTQPTAAQVFGGTLPQRPDAAAGPSRIISLYAKVAVPITILPMVEDTRAKADK